MLNLTDHTHSTYIFSQCNNLDEVAKSCIISYIQKKTLLMSTAINRYSLGSVMESYTRACFPGCETPEWFSHKANGAEIEIEYLARHESEKKIIGVALCAAVSFQDYPVQNRGFLVKCICDFKNADGSLIRRLRCRVGGSTGSGIEPREIESDHVFVCYKSLLVRIPTKASLRFEVIDGEDKVVKCKVLKCGFSMVYEPEGTDHDNVSWEVSFDGSPPLVDDSIHDDESMSFTTQEADEISIDGQGSDDDDDDDEGQQEEENYCVSLNECDIVNVDSDPNMDDETIPRMSLIAASTEIQPECNLFGAIANFNGEVTLEATKSMPLVVVSTKIQPQYNFGEATLEEPPSTQRLHVTPTRLGNNGQGDTITTCFSFLQSFIPCLGRI